MAQLRRKQGEAIMVNWVLRGAVLLWALFFFIVGARGLFAPATYGETFGILLEGAAINTIRADLSAFFLVAAGGAAVGALVPGWVRSLLVPAALSDRTSTRLNSRH